MTFKILGLEEAPVKLIKDLHYTPEYLKLFQNYTGWEAFYAYFEKPEGTVLCPYFKRRIGETNYYDLVGPWYFGGPVTSNKALMPEYLESLHEWCVANNIVSEFQRLHPLLENHKLYLESMVFYDREIVYVALKKPMEVIFKDYDYKTRKNISKANREGLKTLSVEEHDNFIKIYTEAMNRKNTSKFYFFNQAFYDELFKNFSDKIKIFNVTDKEEVICSSMELGFGDTVYDYLRGTNPDSLDKRPNDQVLNEVIMWAKEEGYRYFVIGGGNTNLPDDGQLRFKKSFSGTTASFYLYKKVHDKKVYDELCGQKGIVPVYEQASYFPEY
jgi:lipid II:glycine glycyltransferase (peptidoglycan interpeptide bridge formation enzyme)